MGQQHVEWILNHFRETHDARQVQGNAREKRRALTVP